MQLMMPASIVIVAALVNLLSAAPSRAEDAHCGAGYSRNLACSSGAIAGGGVELHAVVSDVPPDHYEGASSAPPSTLGSAPAGPIKPVVQPPVPRGRVAADVDSPCRPGVGGCLDGDHAFLPPAKAPTKPADPVLVAPAGPGVTLEDVAQFVPRSASIRSQPVGWALVGAPVNLLTDATAQVVDGQLLGRPAQVRFVPVSFVWDYGDGTSTTVQGPGASWRELGQPDFSATDTSHVYPTMGDRSVTLTIAYSPSYRFDGGAWQQIPGTLPVQVGPVTIHVLQGSTVLVGGACGTRDAGPGC
jgi:hypothetical protein